MTTTEPDLDDDYTGPTFGAGPIEIRPFRVVVHSEGDDPEGHIEEFNANKEVDAGLVVQVIRAGDEQSQIVAAARLILNVAIDTDGLASTYVPPRVQNDDPRLDPADAEYDASLSAGDIDEASEEYDERLDDREQWSSARRFTFLLDDPSQYIKQSALMEISQWLISEGGARPTGRPRPSSNGPRATGRGSKARRS